MKTKTITDTEITEAGHDESDVEQVRALCVYLDCGPADIEREKYDHYGLAVYSLGSKQYAVGTDSEADSACADYCKDSAWAFNASFLAGLTDLPEECFSALSSKCEDGNAAVVRMIEKTCGLDEFVSEAVSADGRGHFLSGYDGDENEQGEFFIYRTN
jgi:hypothetical protein